MLYSLSIQAEIPNVVTAEPRRAKTVLSSAVVSWALSPGMAVTNEGQYSQRNTVPMSEKMSEIELESESPASSCNSDALGVSETASAAKRHH